MACKLIGITCTASLILSTSAQSSPGGDLVFTGSCIVPQCVFNPCEPLDAWYQAVGTFPYCAGHPHTQCVIVQECNINCYARYVDLLTGSNIPNCQLIYDYTPATPLPTTPPPSPRPPTARPTTTTTTRAALPVPSPVATAPAPAPAVLPTTPAPTTEEPTEAPTTAEPTENPVPPPTNRPPPIPTPPPTDPVLPPGASPPAAPVIVELFYDPMSNANAWDISMASYVSTVNDPDYCASAECVKISGYKREDTSITRSTPNQFASYTLAFDVTVDNLEDNDYCEVWVRFGATGTWTMMSAYRGSGGELMRFPQRSIVFNNEDVTARDVYVKLAANGDSSSGRDYCYYDNVYLYGTGTVAATQTQGNGAAAAKQNAEQALDPFGHQVLQQGLEHEHVRIVEKDESAASSAQSTSESDKYFAVGSTANTLLWVAATGIWFAACIALFWYRRWSMKQQPVKQLVRVQVHDEHSVADDV